jgi:hypothetical protein
MPTPLEYPHKLSSCTLTPFSPAIKTFLISFALIAHIFAALGTTVSNPASIATMGLRIVIAKYLADGGDINALTMEEVVKKLTLKQQIQLPRESLKIVLKYSEEVGRLIKRRWQR